MGTHHIAPGETVGDLLIEKELGSGAFATVYLARDKLLDRAVALKVSRFPSAAREERTPILREARLVGKLNSPHIVTLYRVHELGGDEWMFEMEFVDGGSLGELLKSQGRLPVRDVLRMLRGMLTGLHVAHQHGVVHRDIKPANVLLGRDGLVKLTDFGLGRQIGEASLSISEEGMLGTPLYMAPEVVMGDHPTAASDIWSVGVVLYHMLSGRLPFKTNNLPNLFLAIQNAEPAPLAVSVPPELAELVRRCLSKSPEDRPDSCAEMLAMLDRLAQVSSDGVREHVAPAEAARIIGRSRELDEFDTFLTRAEQGAGRTVLVSGEAGVGKTTLVREVGTRAEGQGFRWLETALTPFGGLLRPLLLSARDALIADGESSLLGGRLTSARFGPASMLLRGLLIEDVPFDLQSPQQTMWALEQFFVNISKEQPVGLLIEDAHLASSEDLRMLKELGRRLAQARVLLLITYRSHDPDSSDFTGAVSGYHDLSAEAGIIHMDLDTLTPDELYRLLEEQAGGRVVDAEVARLVLEKSEGNPLFALVLFRHLGEIGATTRDDAHVRPGPNWAKADLPQRFHELVEHRLDGLPEEQRMLLDAAAVDGVEFDGEALAAVLERPLLSVLRHLQRLYRERGLVLHRESGYRFAHALFHDVIYAELAPDLRREIHRGLAQHLEKRDAPVDPERLGLHWECAGDRERAAPHLIRAANVAGARQEYRRTIELCERAGLVPGRIDAAAALEHTETLFHLASCLQTTGRTDDMEAVYGIVLEAAKQTGNEQLHTRGFVRLARQHYFAKGLTKEEEARLAVAARELPESLDLGIARWLMGVIAKFAGDLDEAHRWLRDADEIFRKIGSDAYHSSALDELASVAFRAGKLAEAEALYGEAAQVSAKVGRRTNAATSELNRALITFERGVLEGLDSRLEDSIRTLELEGASDIASHAKVFLAEARYAQGDMDGALRVVQDALDNLSSSTYQRGLVNLRMVEGRLLAVRGELDESAASLQEAHAAAKQIKDVEGEIMVMAIEAQRLCFAGDPDAACEAAEEAVSLAADCDQARMRTDLAIWLSESILYGMCPDVLGKAGRLLDAQSAGPVDLARRFMEGARAFVDESGSAADLRRTAEALRSPTVGERRAVHRLIAAWLEAEALRREGDLSAAREAVKDALSGASSVGHVWIELSLLSTPGASDKQASRRAALVSELAARLRDASARSLLESRWNRA